VVVVDDVVVEIRSKARVEAIVDKATEESYVVWVECIFCYFFPHARSCPSPWPDVSVVTECKDIDGIMAFGDTNHAQVEGVV
jgi:hypothetical protein